MFRLEFIAKAPRRRLINLTVPLFDTDGKALIFISAGRNKITTSHEGAINVWDRRTGKSTLPGCAASLTNIAPLKPKQSIPTGCGFDDRPRTLDMLEWEDRVQQALQDIGLSDTHARAVADDHEAFNRAVSMAWLSGVDAQTTAQAIWAAHRDDVIAVDKARRAAGLLPKR